MEEKKLASGRTSTYPNLMRSLYKMYYRESWRTARIVLTIIAAVLIVFGIYSLIIGMSPVVMFIALWAALIMIIYPRNAYRRAYKKSKDEKISAYFAFYEDRMKEKISGEVKYYNYRDMYCVVETPLYMFFFHTKRDVSVLEKSGINDGSAEEIARIIKRKTPNYKKMKKQV